MKEGDPLCPNLLNCILEQIFRELDWEGKGIKILGKNLTNLRFADDIVLVAKNFNELNGMVNITKTKFMTNRGGTNELWTEGTKLTRVDDYRYPGQSTKFANNIWDH